MKGIPLPFDFEGNGVLDLELIVKNRAFITESGDLLLRNCVYSTGFGEPTSVLDSVTTPIRPTSSSTLSSSLGGGGGDTAGVGAVVSDVKTTRKWKPDSTTATSSNAGRSDSSLFPIAPPPEIEASGAGNPEKFAMEDLESVLSDSAAVSPSQEQSILQWIMCDVDDSALGNLNKALQIGAGAGGVFPVPDFDFNGEYGAVNQGFDDNTSIPTLPIVLDNRSSSEKIASLSPNSVSSPNFKFSSISQFPVHLPGSISFHSQNPSFFFPVPYSQHQEHTIFASPPAKRQNVGGFSNSAGQISNGSAMDSGQESLILQQQFSHQLHFPPSYLHQTPKEKQKQIDFEQQATIDLLYKAAELVETGNLILAQEILARLNHQPSSITMPFQRASFYCKEALQLLLQSTDHPSSPFSFIFRIGAYKSLSEISPTVHFTNFTCNQSILEALEGFDRIHIVDFDIGFGTQWPSFMQEVALRSKGVTPVMKITAIVSESIHDHLELCLIRENLVQFANEINILLEFEALSIDSLSSSSPENVAVAVNLPVSALANYQSVLTFVKQLSPRIVVCVDRFTDRVDLSFANHFIHAYNTYTNLLESLDAVDIHTDTIQKIEKFVIKPKLEQIVLSRFRSRSFKKSQHWRSMFSSLGFFPANLSDFAELQGKCVIERSSVRGFLVEKRESSLVLCWQRKELVGVSAWGC